MKVIPLHNDCLMTVQNMLWNYIFSTKLQNHKRVSRSFFLKFHFSLHRCCHFLLHTCCHFLHILLFLLSHFILPVSQVLTLTIARNKQSSASWWSRVTFMYCFFSNCCSDENVKSSSSNEIYDWVRCELYTFFLLSNRSGQYFTTLHFSNHNAP